MLLPHHRFVIGRDDNVVLVDFTPRMPDPPAPLFPGANALRQRPETESESQFLAGPLKAVAG
jgi:hypothetical protein